MYKRVKELYIYTYFLALSSHRTWEQQYPVPGSFLNTTLHKKESGILAEMAPFRMEAGKAQDEPETFCGQKEGIVQRMMRMFHKDIKVCLKELPLATLETV